MIHLNTLPVVVRRRRLLVSGSCLATEDAPTVIAIRTGGTWSVQAFKVGALSWSAWLTLDAGIYTIQAGEDSAQVEVRAAVPVQENLRTALDEHGALDSLERDPAEPLSDYQRRLRDAWLRPGSRALRGTLRNLQRALRLDSKIALVVRTTDPRTVVQVFPDTIRWTCSAYQASETVYYDADLGGVAASQPVRQVLRLVDPSGRELKVDANLRCADPGTLPLELVYQYWRVVEIKDPAETLEKLLLRLNTTCARSGYNAAARKGRCAKGHGPTWPQRFVESAEPYHGCANATCADYRAADPVRFAVAGNYASGAFATDASLLSIPAVQICGDGTPLTFEQVDRTLWLAQIEASEVAVRPLSSAVTRAALAGSSYISSPLRKIQDEMERSFMNLWDRAVLGRTVVTAAGKASYDPVVPAAAPDQVSPDLFASGVASAPPRLRLVAQDDGTWQARIKPGFFWHGAQQFYLYAAKRAVSLASCAVLEIEAARTVWADGFEAGQIGTCESGDPVFLSAVETPLAAQACLARGGDTIPIPASLVQTAPGLIRIALGPLLSQIPGLWESLRRDDSLLFSLLRSSDFTAQGLRVPLGAATLRWRLPSNPIGNTPVVMTNNTARRSDAYRSVAERISRDEFFVDEGWITFSRRPSLIPNGSFERGSEDWRFLNATGATASGDVIQLTDVATLPGSAWRGDAAVLIQAPRAAGFSLQTEATLDAGEHTVSFTARKALLTTTLLDASVSIPMQVKLTPLDAAGHELAWPGLDFDGVSDPFSLSNVWARYAFTFGTGSRRLPAGTARVRVQLVCLGAPSGNYVALVDAVQLEDGALSDYADRAYGFGDDMTIEYETSDGEYVPTMDVNPAVLGTATLGFAEVDAFATIGGTLTRLDDWNPYYDAALREVTLDKSLHRAAVPYAQVSGSNKLRWRRRFGRTDHSEVTTDLASEMTATPRELTLVAPSRLTRGQTAQIVASVASPDGTHGAGIEVNFTLDGPGTVEASALTDDHGRALVSLHVPEITPLLRLTADEPPVSALRDQYGNALDLDLVGELDNAELAVAMSGDAIYTGADLTVLAGGVRSWRPFKTINDRVNRVVTMTDFADLAASNVRQDDRLSRFTIADSVLTGSVRLSINGTVQDAERSLSACYATPGTYFIDYGAERTWIYYHTKTITSFDLNYVPRAIFLGSTIRINRVQLGLPQNCWVRFSPDVRVKVRAQIAGESDPGAASEASIVTVPPLRTLSSGNAPRDLAIVFDQQTSGDLYPPHFGSGDSLRVQLKWRHPASPGAASYLLRWSAKGPTGFYNEIGPCVAQAGDESQPHLFFDVSGSWISRAGAIPAQQTSGVDVIVKWPGSALDDTQDSGVMRDDVSTPVVYNRLTAEAGGGVVWEGGGIDAALYSAEVLCLDSSGRVIGSAVATAQAPDLTPPVPPAVYPSGTTITLTLDERYYDLEHGFSLRADDPTYGADYKALAASGMIRISYLSGTVLAGEPTSGFLVRCAGVTQDLSCAAPSAELASLASAEQYATVVFDAAGALCPPPLVLALPRPGKGSVSVRIESAEPWITQLAGDPAVRVRWSEKTYLRRDQDTGLLSASFDKEVKL